MVVNPKKYQDLAACSVVSVIELLFKTTVVVGETISKTGLYKRLANEFKTSEINENRLSSTIYQLKRSGYISCDGDSVKLTNKAKMKIVDQIAAKCSNSKKYHLVSFDIPEAKRLLRDQFRSAIKRMGFIQIQKSLWVSTRELGDLVDVAAEEYDVSDYVAYFVSESSNIDKHIAKQVKSPRQISNPSIKNSSTKQTHKN